MAQGRSPGQLTPHQLNQLAQLAELLSPEAPRSIAALAELRDDPTVRCATRQRAASDLLRMYFNAVTLPARMETTEDDKTTTMNVLVVNTTDIDEATARAAAKRLERLQLAKQNT